MVSTDLAKKKGVGCMMVISPRSYQEEGIG